MTIAVVGDVLLDIDLAGSATRLSPDAPVPVVDVETETVRAGGAGLVARLLARDGHDVTLVTVLSDDAQSENLRAALAGVRVVAGASNGPTPVKTRLRAGSQAVVRFDDGCSEKPEPTITQEMLNAIGSADAIIVADYGRAVAADPRVRAALEERTGQVPVVWDPHPSGATPVSGVDVVTPNFSEAMRFAELDGGGSPVGTALRAATRIQDKWHPRAVAITLGAGGALLRCADESRESAPRLIPAPAAHGDDPCGAGDRLAATLTAELQTGRPLDQALERAVQSASAFLSAGGVASLDRPLAPPVLRTDATAALDIVARVRSAGGTVVATGGCFDLLHAGHARTLAAARALGDCLIVCLNSDDSIRRLKGSQRPIISQDDRVDLLNALECVDAVVVFDEDRPDNALERVRPDVWVKGGDYDAATLPEAPLIASWGGCVVTVPYYPARSTSHLATALAQVS